MRGWMRMTRPEAGAGSTTVMSEPAGFQRIVGLPAGDGQSQTQTAGDCEEERDAARNHEKVPNRVAKRKPLPAIKQETTSANDPARNYQQDRDGPDHLVERHAPAKAKPTHGEVEWDGNTIKERLFFGTKDDEAIATVQINARSVTPA